MVLRFTRVLYRMCSRCCCQIMSLDLQKFFNTHYCCSSFDSWSWLTYLSVRLNPGLKLHASCTPRFCKKKPRNDCDQEKQSLLAFAWRQRWSVEQVVTYQLQKGLFVQFYCTNDSTNARFVLRILLRVSSVDCNST